MDEERYYLVDDLVEAVYAAGIADGEGYIGIVCTQNKRTVNPHFQVTVHVTNTNRVLVDWLYDRFGGAVHIRKKYNPNAKEQYRWFISSRAAYSFLSVIEPFVLLKREQVRLALELLDRIRPNTGLSKDEVGVRLVIKEAMDILNKRGV